MDTINIVCLNGEYLAAGEAAVPVGDEGLLYGMGLFETIRLYGGSPRLADLHLSRLADSAGRLGLGIPFKLSEIEEMLYRTAEKNGIEEGGLRLTLTAGSAQCRPSLLVQARVQAYGEEMYRDGIRVGFAPFSRNEKSPLVRHKTLNYFENIMARRLASASGWGEALFLNSAGKLAEGSVSNIFLVNRGRVIAPDGNSGLLPGITRRRVINVCVTLEIPLEERVVDPEELYRADECFVTNSLMGVMPVIALESSAVGDGKPGKVTRLLSSEMEKEV